MGLDFLRFSSDGNGSGISGNLTLTRVFRNRTELEHERREPGEVSHQRANGKLCGLASGIHTGNRGTASPPGTLLEEDTVDPNGHPVPVAELKLQDGDAAAGRGPADRKHDAVLTQLLCHVLLFAQRDEAFRPIGDGANGELIMPSMNGNTDFYAFQSLFSCF